VPTGKSPMLALAGLIRAWRNSAAGNRPWLLTISIVGLVLLSLTPVAWLLARPLEIWYDQIPMPKERTDAIVVLAGAVDSPQPLRPYPLMGNDTYVRFQQAVWLFKHWDPLPILACGGGRDGQSYAHTMRHSLSQKAFHKR